MSPARVENGVPRTVRYTHSNHSTADGVFSAFVLEFMYNLKPFFLCDSYDILHIVARL